jgi:putative SOS response-associated peptidase YedK
MIERYSITASAERLQERFSIEVPDYYRSRFNAAPTQLLPVITNTAPGGLSLFYWGTSPEWSKNKSLSEKIVNHRIESIREKPALKRAMVRTRCIVPADGFYAWKKVGKKTSIPYRFTQAAGDLFSLAALWEEFEDTDGNEIQTFSIITVPANEFVSAITDRMPVLLTKQEEASWLDKDATEESLLQILDAAPEIPVTYYPVSPGISNISQDLPSMIIPTAPADQHGNLTLFD